METKIVLPEMKGQKVTILFENGMGFYTTIQGLIVEQGEINPTPYSTKVYILYKPFKKKTAYQITIDINSNIAIYQGYINIDTDHQYIDDVDKNVGCCNPINFDRSLSSTDQQPIFINRKKED